MKPNHERGLTWLAQLGFSLLLIVPTLPPALRFLMDNNANANLVSIVNVLYDDAYYYLQIAFNLAHLGSSSFDGVTPTNGCQPLWLLILTLLAKLTGPDKTEFFWSAVALTQVLALYAIWQAPNLARSAGIRPFYGALLFSLIVIQFNTIYIKGLETVLTLFFLFYLLGRLSRPQDLLTKPLQLGCVFAFAFLVRLDAAATLPAYLLVDAVVNRRRLTSTYLRPLGLVLTPLLITGTIYAALNQTWFGTPVPVSGLAKALDTGRFSNFGILYNYLMSCTPLLPSRSETLALLFWGGALLVEVARHLLCGRLQAHALPLAFLILCTLAQYGYYASFSGWNIWPWYLYFSPFLLFFVILRTLANLRMLVQHAHAGQQLWQTLAKPFQSDKPHLLLALVLLLVAGLYTGLDKARAGLQIADSKRINYGKLNVQQCDRYHDKTVAFGDRAGSLGYWCPTQIVQTEGLVMTQEFLHARAEGNGERWLDEHYDIDLYLVDRDQLPVRAGDSAVYIVVDPVQGRTAHKSLLHFCFPASALIEHNRYGADASRYLFDYRQKIPCGLDEEKIIADILNGDGIRRYSLPAEYRNQPLKVWLENLDRRLSRLFH